MRCCVICGIPLVRGPKEGLGRFRGRQTCGLRTECARALNRQRGLERDFPPQPQCYADGCDRQAVAVGLCLKHYKRAKKYGGDPNAWAPRQTVADRFAEKYQVDTQTGCWIWTGATVEFGYGALHNDDGERIAHRLSWVLHKGPIPEGLCVLHRCDNPPCVNPEHLWLGTIADNNADMDAKGRRRWNSAALRRAPRKYARGDHHPMATISDAQAVEIKSRLKTGSRCFAIADAMRVSRSVVYQINYGKTWRHL